MVAAHFVCCVKVRHCNGFGGHCNIISLASLDLSCQNIASKTGIGKSTVARVLQEVQPDKENHHGGHPSKLSPTNKRAIVQRILTEKASNTVQATHFINTIISTPVSLQTVRNTLKEASLKAVVKKKKPLLSVSHRKRRLAFALKYQHWTVEDWKRVLWSDGQEYVWKRKGEGLTFREVQGIVKFGGGTTFREESRSGILKARLPNLFHRACHCLAWRGQRRRKCTTVSGISLQ